MGTVFLSQDDLLDALFFSQDCCDIASAVQNTDDFNSIGARTIEDDVVFESLHSPHAHAYEPRILCFIYASKLGRSRQEFQALLNCVEKPRFN